MSPGREWEGSWRASHAVSKPGRKGYHTQQHGQRIMIDIAGLQLDRTTAGIQHAGGNAIRTQPVDHRAVTALPQEAAQPEGGTHEQEIIQLVEVPFVVQEDVKHAPAVRDL